MKMHLMINLKKPAQILNVFSLAGFLTLSLILTVMLYIPQAQGQTAPTFETGGAFSVTPVSPGLDSGAIGATVSFRVSADLLIRTAPACSDESPCGTNLLAVQVTWPTDQYALCNGDCAAAGNIENADPSGGDDQTHTYFQVVTTETMAPASSLAGGNISLLQLNDGDSTMSLPIIDTVSITWNASNTTLTVLFLAGSASVISCDAANDDVGVDDCDNFGLFDLTLYIDDDASGAVNARVSANQASPDANDGDVSDDYSPALLEGMVVDSDQINMVVAGLDATELSPTNIDMANAVVLGTITLSDGSPNTDRLPARVNSLLFATPDMDLRFVIGGTPLTAGGMVNNMQTYTYTLEEADRMRLLDGQSVEVEVMGFLNTTVNGFSDNTTIGFTVEAQVAAYSSLGGEEAGELTEEITADRLSATGSIASLYFFAADARYVFDYSLLPNLNLDLDNPPAPQFTIRGLDQHGNQDLDYTPPAAYTVTANRSGVLVRNATVATETVATGEVNIIARPLVDKEVYTFTVTDPDLGASVAVLLGFDIQANRLIANGNPQITIDEATPDQSSVTLNIRAVASGADGCSSGPTCVVDIDFDAGPDRLAATLDSHAATVENVTVSLFAGSIAAGEGSIVLSVGATATGEEPEIIVAVSDNTNELTGFMFNFLFGSLVFDFDLDSNDRLTSRDAVLFALGAEVSIAFAVTQGVNLTYFADDDARNAATTKLESLIPTGDEAAPGNGRFDALDLDSNGRLTSRDAVLFALGAEVSISFAVMQGVNLTYFTDDDASRNEATAKLERILPPTE